MTVAAVATLVLLVALAILAPVLISTDPTIPQIQDRHLPPSWAHPFGTDYLGRDVLVRIIYGARVSLLVGFSAATGAALIGTVLGVVGGYFRGWVDQAVMRLADIQMAFPTLLLVLFVLTIAGGSMVNMIIVIAISRWPVFARVARGTVLSLREQEFVTSAVAVGASSRRIIVKHILPNIYLALVTLTVLEVALAILVEGSLSFLGLGIQPPDISWGLMLAQGRDYVVSAWWEVAFPGLAILITAICLNLVSMALQSRLDPAQANFEAVESRGDPLP